MSKQYRGRLADPEFRRERARNAALTRDSADRFITKLEQRQAELTEEQRQRLISLVTRFSA
ncbi:MAG TPA: hypothetical protein VK878_23320 [Candidatus Deferrimicrobiaceae bacterium]|nr:hypothetical protein [Candidatus Deferrimicrobiaceae bacterium]